jgi:hypothetical protein
LLIGVASWILTGATPSAAHELAYTGSLQLATGGYGLSEPTRSLYFLSGLTLSSGAWRFSSSIPLVAQSTPSISNSGVGPVPGDDPHHPRYVPPATGTTVSRSGELGVGDPSLRAEVEILKPKGSIRSLRLVGVAKAPLAASGRGLGTGAWDYGTGVAVVQRLGGAFAFADVTYWVLGDPAGIDLQNSVAYSVAFGRMLAAGKLGVLGSLSGYTRVLPDFDPPAQLGFLMTYWLRSGRSVTGGAAFGVTDAAPDFTLSLGWRVGLR